MDSVLSYGLAEYHDMLECRARIRLVTGRFVPHGGHHLTWP